jgi:hypothetical protein
MPDDHLDEEILFGAQGWAHLACREVRSDLVLLIDEGWDVPYRSDRERDQERYGSGVVPAERFPSCHGDPAERLRRLDAMVREAGWGGTGLWVSAAALGENPPPGAEPHHLLTPADLEAFYRERARWSAEAGIAYWKVDWGVRAHDSAYRYLVTQVCREEAPQLVVEHVCCTGPLNDEEASGRFAGAWHSDPMRALLGFADVVRTYDVSEELSSATTLDRAAGLLLHSPSCPGSLGLLNVEDEVYLGAALGCCLGIERPTWLPRSRGMEVTRAVRWQRFAPPIGVCRVPVEVDPETLVDSWTFRPGEFWWRPVDGRTVRQGAPARVTRGGLPLPSVSPIGGIRPYVVASRHTEGAIAIATLPRTTPGRGVFQPLARIRLAAQLDVPLGVFGRYASLTLEVPGAIDLRVWAQDLAAGEAIDVTSRVQLDAGEVTLPGALIDEVGRMAQDRSDPSAPGLVVTLRSAS